MYEMFHICSSLIYLALNSLNIFNIEGGNEKFTFASTISEFINWNDIIFSSFKFLFLFNGVLLIFKFFSDFKLFVLFCEVGTKLIIFC